MLALPHGRNLLTGQDLPQSVDKYEAQIDYDGLVVLKDVTDGVKIEIEYRVMQNLDKFHKFSTVQGNIQQKFLMCDTHTFHTLTAQVLIIVS